MYLLDDLFLGNELSGSPVVRISHVHVFDEANFCAETLGVFEQRHELVVVRAADDHGINLQRTELGSGCIDASEYLGQGVEAGE